VRVHVRLHAQVRALPRGQHMIGLDEFVAVARAFGFDRWRIDPSATPLLPVFMAAPSQV
jgi:hypothetical protein